VQREHFPSRNKLTIVVDVQNNLFNARRLEYIPLYLTLHKFCIFASTLYAFHMVLAVNRIFFRKQHLPVGLCREDVIIHNADSFQA
jgi:hypothetical protein